jgi:hypothetical protein
MTSTYDEGPAPDSGSEPRELRRSDNPLGTQPDAGKQAISEARLKPEREWLRHQRKHIEIVRLPKFVRCRR